MNQRRNKWYSIACEWVERNSFDQVPVFSTPALKRDFEMLESLWGIELPEEFVDFYSFSNGFGTRTEGDRSVGWLFVPIESIPQFTKFQRDFFYGSNPRVACSFFPFINYTPDAYGYYSDESNVKINGKLWYYEDALRCHLTLAPDYDWRYFLSERKGGIEDYLQR